MQKACDIVSRVVPNTTQQVDCHYQIAQMYEMAYRENTRRKEFLVLKQRSLESSLKAALICFGTEHPYTTQLQEAIKRN